MNDLRIVRGTVRGRKTVFDEVPVGAQNSAGANKNLAILVDQAEHSAKVGWRMGF